MVSARYIYVNWPLQAIISLSDCLGLRPYSYSIHSICKHCRKFKKLADTGRCYRQWPSTGSFLALSDYPRDYHIAAMAYSPIHSLTCILQFLIRS